MNALCHFSQKLQVRCGSLLTSLFTHLSKHQNMSKTCSKLCVQNGVSFIQEQIHGLICDILPLCLGYFPISVIVSSCKRRHHGTKINHDSGAQSPPDDGLQNPLFATIASGGLDPNTVYQSHGSCHPEN